MIKPAIAKMSLEAVEQPDPGNDQDLMNRLVEKLKTYHKLKIVLLVQLGLLYFKLRWYTITGLLGSAKRNTD